MWQHMRRGWLIGGLLPLLCIVSLASAQIPPEIAHELPAELQAEYAAIREQLTSAPHEALLKSQRFLERARLLDHALAQAHGYSLQGQAYMALGLLEAALEVTKRALELYEAQPRKRARLRYSLHYRLGYLLQQLERYAEALGHYYEATRLLEELHPPDHGEMLRTALAIASVYLVLSDTTRAFYWLARADSLWRLNPERRHLEYRGLWLSLRAFALYRANRPQDGINLLEKAIQEAIQTRDWERAAVRYELLGWLWLELGLPDRAREALYSGLKILERHPQTEAAIRLYTRLCDLELAQANPRKAIAYAQQALRWAYRSGTHTYTLWTLTLLGKAYRMAGELSEAEITLRSACRLAEQRRSSVAGTWWAPVAFGQWQDPYRELVRVLLLQSRIEEALQTLEQTRARYAEDLLLRRTQSRTLSVEALDSLQRLREQLNELYAHRALLPPGRARGAIEDAIAQAELRWTRWREHLLALQKPSILKLDTLQLLLTRQKQIALSYFIEIDTAWVFVLDGTSVRVRGIPASRGRLEELLHEIPWLSGSSSPAEILNRDIPLQALHRLYQLLLAPLEREISTRSRLVIVLDAPLYALPLGMLVYRLPSASSKVGWALERWAISYSPALRLLTLPPPPDSRPRAKLAAAFAQPDRLPERPDMPPLSPLPESRREVSALQRAFSRVWIFQGRRATEATFWQIAPRTSLIHLATHALLDPRDPSGSAILLGPEPGYDGFVQLHELLSHPIGAELVVLSACNTARGMGYVGEGLLSLAYGFFSSGAASLIAALWSVEDAVVAWIMERFYAELRQGKGRDEALRLAQLAYLGQAPEIARHPFFWSSLVLYGQAGPLVLPSRRAFPPELFWAALLVGLFGLGTLIWRRGLLRRLWGRG
jgi:tetratricopeptide (TPR) repeat protein